jgi:hypothetical protein
MAGRSSVDDPRPRVSAYLRSLLVHSNLLVDRVSQPLLEIAFTPTDASLGDPYLRRERSLLHFPVHRRSAKARTLKDRFQSDNS